MYEQIKIMLQERSTGTNVITLCDKTSSKQCIQRQCTPVLNEYWYKSLIYLIIC